MSKVHEMDDAARERLVGRITDLLGDRSDLSFAVLFGSFTSSRPFRDIDVAVWTAPGASGRLDDELAGTLSNATGFPVDVRRINDAPIPFLFHALRGRVVLGENTELLATLRERVARAYHDLAPRLRQATREAFAR